MATAIITIDPYTKGVIESAVKFSDDGKSAQIVQQLDRDKYMAVDKVFRALGGKWSKKAKAHLFDKDVRPELFGVAEAGRAVVEKVIDKKVLWQQFYTPEAVAKKIVAMAEIKPGMRVLEPSAGQGALAIPAREAGGNVLCVEIDPENVEYFLRAGFDNGDIIQRDFLKLIYTPPIVALNGVYVHTDFDRVVMNPPFTKSADVDHVLHALKFLKPGGRLVAIMSKGVTFRETKKYQDFHATMEWCENWEIHALPEYSFEESGTKVAMVVVVIDK